MISSWRIVVNDDNNHVHDNNELMVNSNGWMIIVEFYHSAS